MTEISSTFEYVPLEAGESDDKALEDKAREGCHAV